MTQNFPSWGGVRRILAVRLDAMGDVLMSEPALRALKESHKQGHLTLLTSRSGAEAAKLLDCVDEVLVYEAPWMKATSVSVSPNSDWEMVRILKERKFDAAVILTVYSQNPLPAAFLCHLAEIPKRLGHCRENPYQLLTHWIPDPEPQKKIRHEVQRQLDLVASVGCRVQNESIQISVAHEDRLKCKELLARAGVNLQKPYLVVHTGATAESRRYPPGKFIQAIQLLRSESDWQFLLTGTNSEKGVIEAICTQAGAPCFSLAGALNLQEFAALISDASILISNNTGAVHVAAGVGTPVVDLYALTNPQHTPWKVQNRVLFQDVSCKYCYKSICPEGHNRCLNEIEPRQIAQAALELRSLNFKKQEASFYA